MALSYLGSKKPWGFNAGTGGLGGALENLAQSKADQLNQKLQQKQSKDFWKGIVPEHEAEALSHADPEIQRSLFEKLQTGMGSQEQQQESPIQKSLGLLGQSDQQAYMNALQPQEQRNKNQIIEEAKQQERQKPRYNVINQPFAEREGQLPKQLTTKEQAEAVKAQKAASEAEKKALAERKMKAKEQTRRSLDALPKLSKKEQSEVNKSEKKYYDAALAKYESGKKAEETMDKLEALIDKGDLPYFWTHNLLEKLESSGKYIGKGGTGSIVAPVTGAISGVIVPTVGLLKDIQKGVFSPDTDEFNKVALSFIDGMKAIFGGKVSNDEMKVYLSLIPSLSQTDAGKKAIIKNMRAAVKADRIKYEAMRDIIRENGNKIPQNLGILVNERVEAELGELAEEAFDIPELKKAEAKEAIA